MDCCSSGHAGNHNQRIAKSESSEGKIFGKWVYIIIAIVVVLLIGSLFLGLGRTQGNVVQNSPNSELDKYRSADIPEECRLPEYEDSIESWKEHLGHHQQTWFCLDYFK